MTRFAQEREVYFFEETALDEVEHPSLERHDAHGVKVLVPRLPHDLDPAQRDMAVRRLLDDLIAEMEIRAPLLWYYTPMMLTFSSHLVEEASAVVYDCMDELSSFLGAPPELVSFEAALFERADVVFTGGQSLFESKRRRHGNVHCFPSSVDVDHFVRARQALPDPADQAWIPRPRIGHYAVLDERLDLDLVEALAASRPDWQLVLLGPVVKIDPSSLPRRPNIHYLGGRAYDDLPKYLASWDATFMPFALNAATRYISPTKTPEYLAAGKQVVSTPIPDVVSAFGGPGLVHIAGDPETFAEKLEAVLTESEEGRRARLHRVDRALALMSWNDTWNKMRELLA